MLGKNRQSNNYSKKWKIHLYENNVKYEYRCEYYVDILYEKKWFINKKNISINNYYTLRTKLLTVTFEKLMFS